MSTPRFEEWDLADELPAPGVYPSTITGARVRKSANGNRMVQVLHAIEGGPGTRDRVAEYFMLEGASPRGLALSRRRLVSLYRACGIDPRQGDAINPSELHGARLEVELEHETWQRKRRLRVVGHRLLGSGSTDGAPF